MSVCPTCAWPNRETVDMVCPTCGTDYGATSDPSLTPGVGSAVESSPVPISSEASATASVRGAAHVIPVGDLVEHDADEGCVCLPSPEPVKQEGGSVVWVYTHHSLDGREKREVGE